MKLSTPIRTIFLFCYLLLFPIPYSQSLPLSLHTHSQSYFICSFFLFLYLFLSLFFSPIVVCKVTQSIDIFSLQNGHSLTSLLFNQVTNWIKRNGCYRSTDNKNEMTGSKPNVRNCQSEYKSLYCFKCNSTMPSQKAMSDHQLAVHPEDIRGRSGHTCGDSNNGNSFVDHSQQQINGLQNKVRKTDWLKPKGYMSSVEKIPPKPPTVNNAAKEALEAKKKAQANLIALKEEQLAYENEILQQKLIRGIIPKSSRGRKKFRCESCSKIFSKIESLRDHLRDCIDWEHVSQPIRNLKLPLPAVSDVNGPSLPMSAPASVDWNDTSSDEPPKPPTPGPQFRSQVSKTENPRALTVPPKSTARPQEKLPIKLRNINGVNKSAVENSTRGQVLVMNPKIKENEVILMPLSNANATNKPQSPKTTSPVEIYPKPPRIGDTSVVKSPILPTHMRTNHNTGNSSSDIINITGRNAQTVAPASRGSLKSPVTNEVKDVEIIAVNPPNTKDRTLLNLNNSKQQSPILKVNVNSREQTTRSMTPHQPLHPLDVETATSVKKAASVRLPVA
ncbi:unnamed protein product [Acanthosepion pharaonis]|uniref:C2H2-type domain-containing protein n=1 Tax=Acanthosepion pharaonis TaxID=158019 RepID=A0A812DBM3_ACAPH|nr:unnamed protein product [Sepia pharaonis]